MHFKNKLFKKVFAMVVAEVVRKGTVEETWNVNQQAGLSYRQHWREQVHIIRE